MAMAFVEGITKKNFEEMIRKFEGMLKKFWAKFGNYSGKMFRKVWVCLKKNE